MPVQNTNIKISARPDLATNLLHILTKIRLELIAYCVKKGTFHFNHVLEDGLLGKYFVITPLKSKLKILPRNFCLSKKGFQ